MKYLVVMLSVALLGACGDPQQVSLPESKPTIIADGQPTTQPPPNPIPPVVNPPPENPPPTPTPPPPDPTPPPPPPPMPPPPPGSSDNTFSGTVKGNTFTPVSAIYAPLTLRGFRFVLVQVSDQADPCALLRANKKVKSSTSFLFALYRLGPNVESLPVLPTTYTMEDEPVRAGAYGFASFSKLDATCTPLLTEAEADATSGAVQLVSLGEASAEGQFLMSIGLQGDAVSGRYKAKLCLELAAKVTSTDTTPPTCE